MTTPPLEMIWPHYPAPEGHSCDAMGCASAGPHNIEPELKAMTTPTPRTDALHTIACIASALITGPSEYSRAELKGFANELSSAHLQLERDLAARDAELRYVRETLDKALPGMDEGAPIEAIARKVAAHIAAREAELAELMKWKEAVINELIVAHIYSQVHDDSPRKAVHDAITWNCQVALDPAVSSDAQRLRDTYLQRAEAAERKAEEAARDADAAAIYGNTGRAHGFVGIPKWSELAEETRNLYREALAARAAIAAKGEA